MTGNLEYDGVVGITQCPISPTNTFTYEWQVDETPGRLWFFFLDCTIYYSNQASVTDLSL